MEEIIKSMLYCYAIILTTLIRIEKKILRAISSLVMDIHKATLATCSDEIKQHSLLSYGMPLLVKGITSNPSPREGFVDVDL